MLTDVYTLLITLTRVDISTNAMFVVDSAEHFGGKLPPLTLPAESFIRGRPFRRIRKNSHKINNHGSVIEAGNAFRKTLVLFCDDKHFALVKNLVNRVLQQRRNMRNTLLDITLVRPVDSR